MNLHRHGNRSNCSGPSSVALNRIECSLPQRFVGRQSEIVVGSQVDHFSSVKNRDRFLLALEHAQLRRHAFGPQLAQLIGDILRRILLRRLCSSFGHYTAPVARKYWGEAILLHAEAWSKPPRRHPGLMATAVQNRVFEAQPAALPECALSWRVFPE